MLNISRRVEYIFFLFFSFSLFFSTALTIHHLFKRYYRRLLPDPSIWFARLIVRASRGYSRSRRGRVLENLPPRTSFSPPPKVTLKLILVCTLASLIISPTRIIARRLLRPRHSESNGREGQQRLSLKRSDRSIDGRRRFSFDIDPIAPPRQYNALRRHCSSLQSNDCCPSWPSATWTQLSW